ncbi:MAG: ribosome silencing factor [Candidatus Competibacterales bacterium]
MHLEQLKETIVAALEDLKAVDIRVLDVADVAGFTDLMIIASGNSSRQVKALADRVVERCKGAGVPPLGVEGEREGEWVLVDLGDAVVHIMNPQIREFYNLEKLWSAGEGRSGAVVGS